MKLKLSILILISVFCLTVFAQDDPLVKNNNGIFKVKTKEEMASGEAKLTGKGKAAFEKAKNDFKNVKDAKFDIAPNEQLNQDPTELCGVPANEQPDSKLAERQNNENKKNEKKIKQELSELGVNATALDFSYATTTLKLIQIPCNWNTAILTPVKHQGSCGSCWAFAAVAAFEHTYAKVYGGIKLDLSEQDIVNCGVTCANVDCGSCSGGWSHLAFDFMKCKGVASEMVYPYNPPQSTCIVKPKEKYANTWGQIYPGRYPTIDELKQYVASFGAVVTYMKANISTFFSYGGGVYNGYPSNSNSPSMETNIKSDIDHAVTIVGWCDTEQAWIIKNSWGTAWGPYGGYAYVGYNQCNIGKYVYWVYPNK